MTNFFSMKNLKIRPWIKVVIKCLFIVYIITTNVLNVVYCIALKPGNERIKQEFYKLSGKEESKFLETAQEINLLNHRFSLLLLLVTIVLFLKGKHYLWYAVVGLLTFLGLMYQLYIFGYL